MYLRAVKVDASKQDTAQVCGVETGVLMFTARTNNQRGFTLVELITVMVIAGVLAVAAIPRFFDRNEFDGRAFHDQVISTLRHAQKVAISQRRFVCVTYTSNRSFTLNYGTTAACLSGGLTSPTGVTPYTLTSSSADITLSGYADFSFNALGSPTPPPPEIVVSGYATHIVIEPETGYVH